MTSNVPGSYFKDMYAVTTDPWHLATRWYEQRKYSCTLAVLPNRRYRNGFEPGCSVGVLSESLAQRCDRLLCVDRMSTPVTAAVDRLAGSPHVRVERRAVPRDWPRDSFDLIVISELAYYFDTVDRDLLWDKVVSTLEPEGTLLAVHWRPRVAEHATDGDTVHAELARRPELAKVSGYADADFLLDVYQLASTPVLSVAHRNGLR